MADGILSYVMSVNMKMTSSMVEGPTWMTLRNAELEGWVT